MLVKRPESVDKWGSPGRIERDDCLGTPGQIIEYLNKLAESKGYKSLADMTIEEWVEPLNEADEYLEKLLKQR